MVDQPACHQVPHLALALPDAVDRQQRAGQQRPALPPRQTTLHFLHGDADDIFPAAELQQAFDHLARQQGDATLDIAHGVGHELHPALG